jgi:hypothetical protein
MGGLMFRYRITDEYYNELKAKGLVADESPQYLTEPPQA